MNAFPWYTLSGAAEPLTQGDFIDDCPNLRFSEAGWEAVTAKDDVRKRIESDRESTGFHADRSIVMTQACDLRQEKVRDVVLCPVKTLAEFRATWEYEFRAAKSKSPSESDWKSTCKSLQTGRDHSYAMLEAATLASGIVVPHHVVSLDGAFSVPLVFLRRWVTLLGKDRLRLLPPYREYLSQSFARLFMRVALPIDLTSPK